MDTTSLFTFALQLPDPWMVSGVEFRDGTAGRREPHIAIGFRMGSRFHCPEASCPEEASPVHDVRHEPGIRRGRPPMAPQRRQNIDRFHVIKHANEAVDKVRKAEGRGNGLPKRTKCL